MDELAAAAALDPNLPPPPIEPTAETPPRTVPDLFHAGDAKRPLQALHAFVDAFPLDGDHHDA